MLKPEYESEVKEMQEFYIRLKKAMKLRNISQKELCEKTGIPKSAMSQYVSGSFKPKQDRTYLIAKALDVSIAWLLGRDAPIDLKEGEKMQELKELLRTYLAEETADKLAGIISKDTPIVIDGKQGPTGKTTLCRKLKALGYDAQEQWKAKKSEEHDNGFKVVIFLNKKII